MTGEEALIQLKILNRVGVVNRKGEIIKDTLPYEELYDIIKRDLEMLKLLKKHLVINSWGDIVYESKHHYQYIESEECELFKANEEDTKIKECLKND